MNWTWQDFLDSQEDSSYYQDLYQRSYALETFPTHKTKAIEIQPYDIDWVFLRACLTCPSYKFQYFEGDLRRLQQRVKNPVRIWLARSYLHMTDLITNKNMHHEMKHS